MRNIVMHDLRYYETKLKMRRTEIAIYSDIIDAILEHGSKSNTKIQNSANLEYHRMKRLMKKMQHFGLIDDYLHITEKGKNFRREFEPARKLTAYIFDKYFMKQSNSKNHR